VCSYPRQLVLEREQQPQHFVHRVVAGHDGGRATTFSVPNKLFAEKERNTVTTSAGKGGKGRQNSVLKVGNSTQKVLPVPAGQHSRVGPFPVFLATCGNTASEFTIIIMNNKPLLAVYPPQLLVGCKIATRSVGFFNWPSRRCTSPPLTLTIHSRTVSDTKRRFLTVATATMQCFATTAYYGRLAQTGFQQWVPTSNLTPTTLTRQSHETQVSTSDHNLTPAPLLT
jgi:hypothetical protein